VVDAHSGNYLRFMNYTGIQGTLTVTFVTIFRGGADLDNVVNTTSTAILAFYNDYDYNIAHYAGGGSLRAWTSSNVIIADLGDNGLFGSLIANSGHLEFHQDTGQMINLNGDMEIVNNGIVDIYGGSTDCSIGPNGPVTFTMDSGEFNVRNKGIQISSNNTGTFTISGGTIRTAGSFLDGRGNFYPTGGTVELTGSGYAQATLEASSWFWILRVNKLPTRTSPQGTPLFSDREGNIPPISRTPNLNIMGDCTIRGGYIQDAVNVAALYGDMNCLNGSSLDINGGLFQICGYNVFCGGNLNISGSVFMNPESSLLMSDGGNVNVLDGGQFITDDYSDGWVTVTHNTSGSYGFNVESGATILAAYTVFEYMNANGIFLKPGSSVITTYPFNPFYHCTFRQGAAGGVLLKINNGQSFTITGAVFPANTWGGTYNVSKTVDSGTVYFDQWSGDFGGPDYEQDSYGRIDWEFMGLPMIEDLSISYVLASDQIRLDWSYPIAGTQFKIYRSSIPEGPFSFVGATTDEFWTQDVPGSIFFYRVTAYVP
ncbi:MAG: hypothetical protein ACP5F3_04000, partial [Candidatus Syntrophosphaera sp.]